MSQVPLRSDRLNRAAGGGRPCGASLAGALPLAGSLAPPPPPRPLSPAFTSASNLACRFARFLQVRAGPHAGADDGGAGCGAPAHALRRAGAVLLVTRPPRRPCRPGSSGAPCTSGPTLLHPSKPQLGRASPCAPRSATLHACCSVTRPASEPKGRRSWQREGRAARPIQHRGLGTASPASLAGCAGMP